MNMYCSYCESKIFEADRTCNQCGAPTKNHTSKENRKTNIEGRYENQIAICGYTQKDFVTTCQKVSAWNGGVIPIAVCDENYLSNIVPFNESYRYGSTIKNFLGFDISTDEKLLKKLRAFDSHGSSGNRMYIVCIHNDVLGNVIGSIDYN